jgi:hypothetical protein
LRRPASASNEQSTIPKKLALGLDHRKSDVSDLRPFKVPELGNTRVRKSDVSDLRQWQNSGTPEFCWRMPVFRKDHAPPNNDASATDDKS